MAFFIEWLDASALNTALPQIAFGFHVNPVLLKEALTAYLLSVGIFIPVSGTLCDRIGIKPTFIIAVLVFMLGSIGCSFAWNITSLVLFRIVQGIGGALLTPVGRMIMLKTYGAKQVSLAMVRIAMVSLAGMIIGPVFGGALATWLTWRWVFWINIPICLATLAFVIHRMPRFEKPLSIERFDWQGFILIAAGLALALYAVDILVDAHISTLWKGGLLCISAFSFVAYHRHAKHAPHPLFAPALFAIKRFSLISISSFLVRLAISTPVFLVPLLLQAGYHQSAFTSGLIILPYALALGICKKLVKPMQQYLGPNKAITLSLLYNSMVLIGFGTSIGNHMTLIPLLLFSALAGVGFSVQATLLNTEIYQAVPESLHSQAVPCNSAVIQLSASFGVAIAALLLVSQMGGGDLYHTIPVHAFKVTFWIEAAFPLLALITSTQSH